MLLWRLRTGLRSFAYGMDDLGVIRQAGKPNDHLKERPQLARERKKRELPSLDNEPSSAAEEEQMLNENEESQRKEYKRKINKTAEDFEIEQLREKERDFSKMVREYFKNENAGFDTQNYTRIEKTKRLTRAMRLNSVFDFDKKKSPMQLSANYNNYDKFKLNFSYFYTKQEVDKKDTGLPMRQKMLTEYISGLAPDGNEDESKASSARERERQNKEPSNSESAWDELLEEGIEDAEHGDLDNKEEAAGRLSPHAREQIYRLYENGWTVTDISYRYGILPARVKAIVWCRRHFYEEIEPRIDPITWKLAVQKEFMYASDFPFVDYGVDLQLMAHLEKGIATARLTHKRTDPKPPKELIEKMETVMNLIKPMQRKMVERTVVGKGPHAYKVKDLVVCWGNGRHTVSEMFKRVCMWSDTKPHWLPDKVRAKIDQGPRIASQGYRMGSRMRPNR